MAKIWRDRRDELAAAILRDPAGASIPDPRGAVPVSLEDEWGLANVQAREEERREQRMEDTRAVIEEARREETRVWFEAFLAGPLSNTLTPRGGDGDEAPSNGPGRPSVAQPDELRLRKLIDEHPGDMRTARKKFVAHLEDVEMLSRRTANRRYRDAKKAVLVG